METADSLRRPRSLPVGHEIPAGATLDKIEDAYKDRKEAIPCGRSSCHARHKKGYVVSFTAADGTRGEGLIGHVCGKNHFGLATWTASIRAHRGQEQMALQTEHLMDKTAQCRQIEPHLEALHTIASAVSSVRSEIHRAFPDFFRVCEAAARSRGGIISGNQHRTGKPFQVRLHHSSFWIRVDLAGRVGLLKGSVRLFLERAHLRQTPKEQARMLAAFTSPKDQFRRLVNDVIRDIEALYPEHITTAITGYQALTGVGTLRVQGQHLAVHSEGYGIIPSTWEPIVDLGGFHGLAGQLPALLEDATEGSN